MVAAILLVEDHPTMREAMRMILEAEGHRIAEAADGRAALEQLRANRFDVILLDLNIPGLSGIDLLQAIRSEPAAAGVCVVVVTATGEEGRAAAMAAGADDYFTKPFSPAALLATVERASGASGSPEA